MIKSASRKDVIWGYIAQFLNIGTGAIIIPVAIKYLNSEDMGFWYLFIAIAALAKLFEFGFQPTLSRMTSYVYSGADTIKAEGLPDLGNAKLKIQVLYDLIAAAKKLYRYVAIASLLLMLVIGTAYLQTFPDFQSSQLYSWQLYCFASIISFYYTYFNGLLKGRGQQVELYRIVTISKLVMLCISIVLLVNDIGLLSMSIGYFFSVIVSRFLSRKVFYDLDRSEVIEIKGVEIIVNDYTKVLLGSAWKLGVTSLGTFLIKKSSIFIVSSFVSLQAAASLGITMQIMTIIYSVSSMIFSLNLPKLNSLQFNSDRVQLKLLLYKSLFLSLLLYLLFCLCFVVFYFLVYPLFLFETPLVDFNILMLIIVMLLLEMNHSICAGYFTTYNEVPFFRSSIISGLSIVSLSLISVQFFEACIFYVLLPQFTIQLLYNNWYWPLATYRELRDAV